MDTPFPWLISFRITTAWAMTTSTSLTRTPSYRQQLEFKFYEKPESRGISKWAMSVTADAGFEFGGGVSCQRTSSEDSAETKLYRLHGLQ